MKQEGRRNFSLYNGINTSVVADVDDNDDDGGNIHSHIHTYA